MRISTCHYCIIIMLLQGCHSLCCSGAHCFCEIGTNIANHLLEELINVFIVEIARYVHARTSMVCDE